MRSLATRAIRFTPAVHVHAPNALLLDVHGSLKFFGGLERLRALLVEDLGACGYDILLACAPTALAALWLARSGCNETVCDCAELPGRLSGLPIDCLDWPENASRTLAGMGVATIGECIRLPRDGLARRIGPDRLEELDQAFGARPELRSFHRPPRRFESSLDLSAEATDAGLLLVALQELLDRLAAFLRRHQGAVQVLWISLHHQDWPVEVERIGLLRAASDTGYLFELARIRFADLQLAAPVVAITLQTVLTPSRVGAGRDLLGARAEHSEDALALVEQLRIRLGAEAVHGIQLVPEHRPETAWRPVAFPGHSSSCDAALAGWPDTVAGRFRYAPVACRPFWMLEQPRALQAPAGQPRFGGMLELEGDPERIETGWWDSRDVRRDYYVARNRSGMRLWVYRDHREARWYLHGLFG